MQSLWVHLAFLVVLVLCHCAMIGEASNRRRLRRAGDHDRRTQNCNFNQFDVQPEFYLESSHLDIIQEASKLVQLEPRTPPDELKEQAPEIIGVWRDIDDRVILAKHNEHCYLAFGIPAGSPFDHLQNLNPFTRQVGDCRVRSGFYQAYNMSKADEYHRELQSCLQSCGATTCGLVTTGYSQGGAVAVVAAVDLSRYSPITVSFGATKAIMDPNSWLGRGNPCTQFVADRHYQFVNVLDGEYDSVAIDGPSRFWATHAGRLLLLEDEGRVCNPELLQFGADFARFPTGIRAHHPDLYKERLEGFTKLAVGCSSLPIGRWESGRSCNYEDECDSGVCNNNVCD